MSYFLTGLSWGIGISVLIGVTISVFRAVRETGEDID